MGIIIGLDIGGSTTKVVALKDGSIVYKKILYTNEPINAAETAVEEVCSNCGYEIEAIHLTGAGSSYIEEGMLPYPIIKVPEFESISAGGLYLSGLTEAVIASAGTGTAMIKATVDSASHIIGTGVGGGTLIGLAKILLEDEYSIEAIDEMYSTDILSKIDLTIGDISKSDISLLSKDVTASNFGKASLRNTSEEKISGIVNLVSQSIGTLSVMASRKTEIKDVVFIGQLTRFEAVKTVLRTFPPFYDVNFVFPEDAEFGTAIGAALIGGL